MLYLSLGRCFDPRNLRRSGVTVEEVVDWRWFDFDDIVVVGEDFIVDLLDELEEFVRLPLSLLPRRDAMSLLSRRCRDVLRLLNLRRMNDGIIDLSDRPRVL